MGSSRKISIYGGIAWNEGELGHFADLRGVGLGKKERAGVLEEWLMPQWTLGIMTFCHNILPIQDCEKPSYEAKGN